MPGVEARVTGVEELQKEVTRISRELHGSKMIRTMRKATRLILRDARKGAPVDTGLMRADILPEVIEAGPTVMGIVGTEKEYASYMEFGTRPHWPPPGALAGWARRHGAVEFLVARAIARYGIEGRHFMENAANRNAKKIEQMLGDTITEIVVRG